jgi:hypothetical protein
MAGLRGEKQFPRFLSYGIRKRPSTDTNGKRHLRE